MGGGGRGQVHISMFFLQEALSMSTSLPYSPTRLLANVRMPHRRHACINALISTHSRYFARSLCPLNHACMRHSPLNRQQGRPQVLYNPPVGAVMFNRNTTSSSLLC